MNEPAALELTVNGQARTCRPADHHTLLDVLRGELGLMGTHEGCRTGECGACTVLLDGRPAPACLVLARRAAGRAITTIEGLAPAGQLHPLQAAFVALGALQCGFCTPGMLLTAAALLARPRAAPPSDREVRAALSGNLCRCTGYAKIVEAIRAPGEGEAAHER
jgi:carbon-monoxide dehydrogenase small subunit